jgi:chorismate-pyruvate lyase
VPAKKSASCTKWPKHRFTFPASRDGATGPTVTTDAPMRFNSVVTLRSCLESAFSQSGTTVTAFLEQLAGEPVDAHERHHAMIEAGMANFLGVEEGHPLLQRTAVLQGRRSMQPYARVESLLDPSRLPAGFCRQLETGNDPIGRILCKDGIAFTRSELPGLDRGRALVLCDSPVPEDYLFARTYRIDLDGVAVILISEWFLRVLESLLGPER